MLHVGHPFMSGIFVWCVTFLAFSIFTLAEILIGTNQELASLKSTIQDMSWAPLRNGDDHDSASASDHDHDSASDHDHAVAAAAVSPSPAVPDSAGASLDAAAL